MSTVGDTKETTPQAGPKVDLSGPLPMVDMNLLPDIDNATLPQSPLPSQN